MTKPKTVTAPAGLPSVSEDDAVEFPARKSGGGRKPVPSPYQGVVDTDAATLASGTEPRARLIRCADEQRKPVVRALRRAGATASVTVLTADHAEGIVFRVRARIARPRKS